MRTVLACCLLVMAHWLSPAAAQEKQPPPGAQPTDAKTEASGPPAQQTWRVTRTAWTDQDERAFEEFIERIGESDCRTVHECLTSAKSNPLYRASNPLGMHFNADCADLPYLLRAYFAWKNGLPFAYSASVSPAGRDSSDIRFNDVGVRISSRRDLTGPMIDARREIPQMLGLVTSAHFRYAPDYAGPLLPDHYPVKITRESIKPGTILYDPYGHLAVVYKVTAQGRVHFIDAHPGNALTRGVYGKAHKRYIPEVGGGFKRWRPQKLVGATQLGDGSYQGGSIVLAADKDLGDWSAEQFFGTEPKRPKDWEKGRFVHDGEALEYYQFVRRRLAKGHFRYDPVEETRSMVRVLCEDLQYRVHAVDAAIAAGMHLRPQPDRLPDNIYGTSGDWEVHSTPSRDARLKTAFKELRDEIARFLELAAAGSDHIAYSGSDLRRDLLDVYTREASACTISYARTGGRLKQLSFADVTRRLHLLSFDPHHCVERRWGANDKDELSTCTDGPNKAEWYAAEQRLRNQIERIYHVRMDFSLADLRRKAPGSGVDDPPDADVLKLLSGMAAHNEQANRSE
jgi:hypothetical protein